MSGIFGGLAAAPIVRPSLYMGGMFDIPTGKYLFGKHGESLLNSGLGAVNSIQGPANAYKSELAGSIAFNALRMYPTTIGVFYDTENTMSYQRLIRFMGENGMDRFDEFFDPETGRLRLTQSCDMLGDVFFEEIKKIAHERIKNRKKLERATPFIDRHGEYIKILNPYILIVDSLSMFQIAAIQNNMIDKNALGDSKTNTQSMQEGRIKSMMITQLPNLCIQAGMYYVQTTHQGNDIDMNTGMPVKASLAYSRSGVKVKGAPPKYNYINNNLLEIVGARFANNSSTDKSARYPKLERDRLDENKDLMMIEITTTRNKSGGSGIPYQIFVSQSEGLQQHLSMYHYLSDSTVGKGYGMEVTGNNLSFKLHLYPDVTLSRTTIRSKIEEDYKLKRALEFTTQIRQMEMLWSAKENEHLQQPKAVYDAVSAQGYDWNILLGETRGHWLFIDEDDGKHYLSTMDLLRMAKGLYRPYWYDAFIAGKTDVKEKKAKKEK